MMVSLTIRLPTSPSEWPSAWTSASFGTSHQSGVLLVKPPSDRASFTKALFTLGELTRRQRNRPDACATACPVGMESR